MMNSLLKNVVKYFTGYKTNDFGVQYAIDVVTTDKYKTSKYVYKICLRTLLWLYKSMNDENFPYFYDSKLVKTAYAFFKLQIMPEKKVPYILAPYRAFMLSSILGWKYKSNPKKLVIQEVMDTEARKNGKSTFNAIFAKFVAAGFLGDGFPSVFIAGAGDKSSAVVYKLIGDLIRVNPIMQKEFLKNNRDVIKHKSGGEIKKLPFEKSAIEGQNPSLVILTEFHLHPDNRMQESARTAINESRDTQLIFYDTTKGQNLDSPYYFEEKKFKSFLDANIDDPEKVGYNDHIFLFCAELDEDKYAEWDNPENWKMANPNIGITLALDTLKKQFQSLVHKSDLLDFKVKKIGMWVNQGSAYFELSDILESQDKNREYVNNLIRSGKFHNEYTCILGLDLSNSGDTTAIVATFEIPQEDNESIWVIQHLGFIPKEKAIEKERTDRVPYFEWKSKHFLEFCEGSVIDLNQVAERTQGFVNQYQVKKIAYDKWQFMFLKNKLTQDFYFKDDDLVPVAQGVQLTPSIKEFERKLKLQKVFIVDDNSMLINHILNLSMKPSKNINNNFYPEKVQPNSRIDGAIAMFTALFLRCDVNPENKGNVIFSSIF